MRSSLNLERIYIDLRVLFESFFFFFEEKKEVSLIVVKILMFKFFLSHSLKQIQSTLDITEPELNRILVITEHFLIPVTAQYLPMYFTFDANRIFLL